MKRRIKRLTGIVLVLTMLLALAGYGGDKEALLGKWEAELDFTERMKGELEKAMGGGMMDYFQFSAFEIACILEFREDDTYTMAVDWDKMNKTMDTFKEDLTGGLVKYMEDLIAAEGLDMSVDALLAASGSSIGELMDETFSDEMVKDMIREIAEAMEISGTFSAVDGKLNLNGVLSDYVVEYVLDGDTLTLKMPADSSENQDGLYPAVFHKAA